MQQYSICHPEYNSIHLGKMDVTGLIQQHETKYSM